MQIVLHNTEAKHNIRGLPVPDKSPVQLDLYLMGGYSFIDCHYPARGRSFRAAINWNNAALVLNWVENSTAANSVMLVGNQTVAGMKTFAARSDFAAGIRFSAASKDGWAELGMGPSDIYLRNPASRKVLQLKDDGSLAYSNEKILLAGDKSDAVNLADSNKLATSKAVKTAYERGSTALQAAGQAAPSGTVAYFAGAAAPAGWLKANGAAVSRTVYAALFAAIGTIYGAGDGRTTFNLPDLRGEFVRGYDDGRNIDRNRAFGSRQDDAFQGHARNLKRSQSDARMHGVNYFQNVEINSNQHSPAPATVNSGDNWLTEDYLQHKNYGTPRVAAETRPRNLALLACIKI
ncbi:tail fiber protein [Neisseria sp. 19428wB4_WF04]|nr:tail fiber protein [Neisseria sp. 19428wB4_WF04]TFU44521.1 tail fiber protein [Neisseria sp. WF04]